jgi:hypothetical protein
MKTYLSDLSNNAPEGINDTYDLGFEDVADPEPICKRCGEIVSECICDEYESVEPEETEPIDLNKKLIESAQKLYNAEKAMANLKKIDF